MASRSRSPSRTKHLAELGKSVTNFSNMTIPELKDTLARQKLLINNKRLLSRLPDKGQHVLETYERLEQELNHHEKLEDITNALDKLSISCEDPHSIRVISKENHSPKRKFKPCNSTQFDKKPNGINDSNHPQTTQKTVQVIALTESLGLLKNREQRVQDEMLKRRREMLVTETDQIEGTYSKTESEEDNDE